MRVWRWGMMGVVLAALVGPALAMGHDKLEIITADGRAHRFVVEVAVTEAEMEQGLMFRRTMAADAGMIFDFHRTKGVSMWMKNTLIPLDMIFIGQDGRVTGVAERAVPESLEIISSPGPARAVLEVNGGTVSAQGIKPGDRVICTLFPRDR